MLKSKNNKIQLAIIFLFAFLLLFIENRYFNVTSAKAHAAFFGGLAFLLFAIIFSSTDNKVGSKFNIRNLKMYEIFLVAFAILSLISCIFSLNPIVSFFGFGGWGVGLGLMIIYLIIYFYISRSYEYKNVLFVPIFIILSVLIFIAVLEACGLDILTMHKNISQDQYYSFYSLFGNANQMSLTISITLPIGLYYFITSEKFPSKIILSIFIILSFFGTVICASDSMLVGIFVIIFFGLSISKESASRLHNSFVLVIIYGIVLGLISILPCFADFKANVGGCISYLLFPYVYIPLVIIGLIGILIKPSFFDTLIKKGIAKKLVLAIRILMIIVLIGAIFVLLQDFSDYSGTKRIGIWRISLEIFSEDFTLKQKLIGVGPEMLYTTYDKVNAWFGQSVLSSHSQIIQMLMTGGILGLASYVAFWICFIILSFKTKLKENEFFIPIISFGAMLLFNTPSAMNFAIFFIILSLYASKLNSLDIKKEFLSGLEDKIRDKLISKS